MIRCKDIEIKMDNGDTIYVDYMIAEDSYDFYRYMFEEYGDFGKVKLIENKIKFIENDDKSKTTMIAKNHIVSISFTEEKIK